MKRWFVYLARCRDGSLYTGITVDPGARERTHNAGRGGAYTRSRRPVRLVRIEGPLSRSGALKREAAIKRLSRRAKLELVSPLPRTGSRAVRISAPIPGPPGSR